MTDQERFIIRMRRFREHQRIPLAEIAAHIRVKVELLEAFERGDLSAWPRGLYARAWIRDYAHAVGFDPVETVNDFCRLFPHGDRRAGATLQGIADIVASPSEYRDEFSHVVERRGMTSLGPASSTWREVPTLAMFRFMRAMGLDRTLGTSEAETTRSMHTA
jgi:Helix-turn-helix domain